ncbi:MAG: protein-glutamine gamma-glutamyltransferase [Solirubrobacteraceae bacterium]
MGAVALPAPGRAPSRTLARPAFARLSAFAALGLFGALHWGGLLEPGRGGTLFLSLVIALLGAGALIAVPADAPDWKRRTIAIAVAIALLASALLCAGVPARMLGPRGWDDLVSGLNDGISITPGITVPYRGLDDWVRIAILSGGTALLGLATLLAFWPRRGGGLRSPIPAAVALGVLYAVPIIEHGPDSPYLGGAVFGILLVAFLWLERLRTDQLGVAIACVALTTIAGAIVAPRLDGTRPWFNYEAFAEKLEPKKAEAFSWTHSYGPLNWPRDGREMLRVKAKQSAYWKATNLDLFDGVRWREGQPSRDDVADETLNRRWLQRVQVIDRGLRSHEFIGAGVTLNILPGASRVALPRSNGTYVTGSSALRPGDSYQALVYTPRPSDRQLKAAGANYPGYLQDFLEMRVPLRGSSRFLKDEVTGRPLGPNAVVRFPAYGDDENVPGIVWPSRFGVQPLGEQVLGDSPYERLYQLATSIADTSQSPYDYTQKVLERVQQGAEYDESPPASRYPLASFLFDTKAGYCQQFSGTMALMLRMGGVPARVASGFSPGSYDRDRKEYVVRDTDAHSWVEAYFPKIGWVTFDPTPSAAPATSQLGDVSSGGGGAVGPLQLPTGLGQSGDRPFAAGDPGADVAPTDGGGGWQLPVAGGVAALLVAIAGLVLWRRRRPFVPLAPELAELQRALRRSGRHPAPNVTLTKLEGLLGGSDAAAGYVRAIRDQRFSREARGPTAAQRRALRRVLGAGLGARGRLIQIWALPPKLPPAGPLKARLRRS